MNFYILIKNDDLATKIKSELYRQISGELFINHLETYEDILKTNMNEVFLVIVDIDDYSSLSEQTKMNQQWKNVYFIYVSKNKNKCIDVIGYNVLGYYLYEQIDLLAKNIRQYYKKLGPDKDCYFKTPNGYELFKYSEIILFEIKNRNVYLKTIHKETRLINYKLYQIIEMLDARFIQVNRSVIVNIDKIKSINNQNEIELVGLISESIKISNKYKMNLDKKIHILDKNK